MLWDTKEMKLLHEKVNHLIEEKNSLWKITSSLSHQQNSIKTSSLTLKDLLEKLKKNRIQKATVIASLTSKLPYDLSSLNNRGVELPNTLPRYSALGQAHKGGNMPQASSFTANKLKLKLPVSGKISEVFGGMDKIGLRKKGITITTTPGARVSSSFDGKVLYASDFRDYGLVLIIDHGSGFNTHISQ